MSQSLNDQNTMLTGAKQTMSAWTKVIESREAVPVIYKDIFETHFSDHQQFPYVVFTPALDKYLLKTTEKLICSATDAIHIFELSDRQITTKSYPYQTVYSVEVGNVLLSSWLTISGRTSTGADNISTINFNTASARHFETFMNKLRPSPQGTDNAKLNVEKDKFNYLSALNFKLMSFGRSSLVYGETVRQILLQPEIRKPIWPVLGRMFLRTAFPAYLTILTNQELILIHEIAHRKDNPGPCYGGIWQYIPLRSISSVTLSEPVNDRVALSITLTSTETTTKIFDASSQPELDQLYAQVLALST